jgi:hypothetical protein
VKKLFILPAIIFTSQAIAQSSNTINTAVPFLLLDPDVRASGMGDAGIATSPDAHSIFWNTAKLVFIQNRFGLSATYTPTFNKVESDIFLFDASTYWKIDSNDAITASIRYFHAAKLTFTNASGMVLGIYRPVEYTLHLGYSRKFGRHLSAGVNLGYVRSNLAAGYTVNNVTLEIAKSFMADVSLFYSHPVKKNSVFRNYNFGLTISSLGGKISYYSQISSGDFLPANLGLGSNFNFQFGKDHQLGLAFDLNKLLVPTPDSAGNFRNESVAEGIFKSFADAPGGVHEELQEINASFGVEYWWKKMIALRTGYFYESKYKGDRHYFCLGAGFKYHFIQFDYSYQINTSNPELNNIMRFGLSCDLNSFRKIAPKKS